MKLFGGSKVSLLFIGLLSITAASLTAQDTWTKKADMPTARYGLSSSVVDGKICAIGGATASQKDLRTVEQYDPATDTWTKKADMPNTRCWHSASVVNGKIYIIGGYAAGTLSGMVEEYDPVTDTWTRKADMPTPRWVLSTSVVNGKIYAIAGAAEAFGECFDTVEEYDPETDTWTRKADMPTRRFALSTGVVNGRIYVIGGASGWQAFVRAVEEYDPATDTWARRANIPTPRWWLSSSTVNGKIYAIGGCVDVHGVTFSTVEEYDPQKDSWIKKADMPTPRKALATSVVNGKIYAIGGSAVPHWDAGFSMVEEYHPDPFIVDLNGDEKVDFRDFSLLAEYWRQDESPFTNRRVNCEDLAVFADYWLQEILPASLVAYWKLDETEGVIAYDSVGNYDATLHGDPIWQPAGGIVNGALELDGLDDFVSTPFVVGAVDAPFSVLAWVKGGAPGQVILSQKAVPGVGWLATDPSNGSLVTDYPGLLRRSLASETVVTDGQWHRVGLVWDPPDRALYINDVEVARDKHPLLGGSDAGLYIGAGSDLAPGTFFSGLIDDVRIHDQAIEP